MLLCYVSKAYKILYMSTYFAMLWHKIPENNLTGLPSLDLIMFIVFYYGN